MTTNDPLDPMIPAQPQPSKARKEQAPRAEGAPATHHNTCPRGERCVCYITVTRKLHMQEETEKCEGCGEPSVGYDTEGVPLCAECAAACLDLNEESLADNRPNKTERYTGGDLLERLVRRRLQPRFQWHWRRGGGIYFGLRLQFPCNVIYDEDPDASWKTWSLSIGLIAATLHLDVLTKRRSGQ